MGLRGDGRCLFDSLTKTKPCGLNNTVDQIQQESKSDSGADGGDDAERGPQLCPARRGQCDQAHEHEINYSGAGHDGRSRSRSCASV